MRKKEPFLDRHPRTALWLSLLALLISLIDFLFDINLTK